jgi:protein-disulfide isomerase
MRTTRRALLASGAAVSAGLAGCLGGIAGSSGGGGVGGGCSVDPRGTVEELPTPVLGSDDAPVVVETYEDFACPHCATFSAQITPQVVSEYVDPGDVRLAFRDFPIPVSEQWSWGVASAARAVQETTDDETFFAFVEAAFANQGNYSMDTIQSIADDVGADGCTVRAAATREPYRPVVEADRQRGIDAGVQGTPSVFVDGQQLSNTSFDAISSAIDARL